MKPYRRRLRRPDPDVDEFDWLPPEDPDAPRCAHCTGRITYGGLVVVGSATLHTACERGWRARKTLPLF